MLHPAKSGLKRPSSPARAARDAKRALARLARSIHAEHQHAWSIHEAMAFADALMPDRYLEAKSVGIEVVARLSSRERSFDPTDDAAIRDRAVSREEAAHPARADAD